MYTIYQGSEVLESTSYIEYVKLQSNGKKVTSTAGDYDFVYSRDSDKMYDKNLVSVQETDEAFPSREQELEGQVADLQNQLLTMMTGG